jgi:hypothetical protein
VAYRVRGTTLPDGGVQDVFVVDGRFTFKGVDGAETLLEDGVLLPGLVDAHAHLALASPAPPEATSRERIQASAEAHLRAGVLVVREPGSPNHDPEGVGPSSGHPRVITAGRFLSPPDRYFPGLAREVTEDRLPGAAEEELRSGGWVKIIGDSPFPGPGFSRTFSAEALREAASRVHTGGGRIAIHCMLPEVIQDAIEAGFDSLEHGSAMQARPGRCGRRTRRRVDTDAVDRRGDPVDDEGPGLGRTMRSPPSMSAWTANRSCCKRPSRRV